MTKFLIVSEATSVMAGEVALVPATAKSLHPALRDSLFHHRTARSKVKRPFAARAHSKPTISRRIALWDTYPGSHSPPEVSAAGDADVGSFIRASDA